MAHLCNLHAKPHPYCTMRSFQAGKERKEDDEALIKESMDIIMTWKPASDVFPWKSFMFAFAFVGSGSSVYINACYRKAVKLRNQALITSLIPVVIIPSVIGGLMHHQFIHRPLLLRTFKCPVCVELRGGLVQLFAGLVYPVMLAPMVAFQFATRLYTYPVPDARNPKNVIKELIKITKPFASKLCILAGVQIIAGVAWTHWELHSLLTVSAKISEMEETLKEHHKSKYNV